MELCSLEVLQNLSARSGFTITSPAEILAGVFQPVPLLTSPKQDLPTIAESPSSRFQQSSLAAEDNELGLGGILDQPSPIQAPLPAFAGGLGMRSLPQAPSGGNLADNGLGSGGVFDQFEARTPKPPASKISATGDGSGVGMGSIFDQFDAPRPPPRPKQEAPANDGQGSGSIFDDFDVPAVPARRSPPPPSDGGCMGSGSIFDQFDVPVPSRPKPAPPATDSGMGSGSIFDQFDAPRPPPRPKPEADSGIGSGSIFDNFDVPPQASSLSKRPSSESGLGDGGIFDQYSLPPQIPLHMRQYSGPRGGSPSTDSAGMAHTRQSSEASLLSFGQVEPFNDGGVTPPTSVSPRRLRRVPLANIAKLSLAVGPYSDEDKESYKSDMLDLAFWVVERKTTLCATRLVEELKPMIEEWKAYCPLMAADHSGNGNHKEAPPFGSSSGHFYREAESLLYSLCQRYEVQAQPVLAAAIRTIGFPGRSLPLCSLLVHMLDRPSTLNILIRQAVRKVLHRCSLASKALLGYEVLTPEGTALPQSLRDELIQLVWDLEVCLFFHLEGSLKLSRKTILEMTVGSRVALLLVSWRVNYPALQLLISHPPHTNLVADGSAQSLEEEEPPHVPRDGSEGSAGRATPSPRVEGVHNRSFSDDLDDGTEENDSVLDEEVDPLTDLATTVADISRAEASKDGKGSNRPTRHRRRSSASHATLESEVGEEKSRDRASTYGAPTTDGVFEVKTTHARKSSLPANTASTSSGVVEEKHRRQYTMPHLSNVTESLSGGEPERPRRLTADSKSTSRTKKHKFVSTPDFERLRAMVGGSHEHLHVSASVDGLR